MNVARTSTAITTLSALVLAAGGIALLFGPEELLGLAMPGTAGSATVLGQLVAAGWLAVAGLNWNQRSTIVGGIYGRPMVLANFALYMITAFSLAHPAIAGGAPRAFGTLAVVFGMFALLYAVLLLRGPFGSDR